MPAELAIPLLCLLAQLPKLLRIVEDVCESPLFLLVRLAGPMPGLAGFVERMSKALLLPGRRLAQGPLHLRLSREGSILAEPVAKLLDRELRAGPADRHRVEIGAVPLIVGQDGFAGGCQHLGGLAPFGPCVEADNGKAPLAGLTLKDLVRLDMTFGRGQIALGGLLRGGLLVMVVEELVEHVARMPGQAGIVGERADAADEPVVAVHQE